MRPGYFAVGDEVDYQHPTRPQERVHGTILLTSGWRASVRDKHGGRTLVALENLRHTNELVRFAREIA